MNEEPIITPETDEATPLDSEVVAEQHTSHLGLIVGILIVVLALILIGWLVWDYLSPKTVTEQTVTPERPTAAENQEPESETARAQTDALNAMSTSDEIDVITVDLGATDLDSIDTEMNAIEAELQKEF